MYQTPVTIRTTVDAIQDNKYVLPAIQREFVWQPKQIYGFFDSIMQDYPFGTFLFWKVEASNSSKYNFYGFVRDYDERKPHCPELSTIHKREVTAVLDGQQRLTALNIGLCGSMSLRKPGKWRNNPNAYPLWYLYLDLLAVNGDDEETGERYRFKFLTEDEAKSNSPNECWFKVADIRGMQTGPAMWSWVNERLPKEKTVQASITLDQLFQVVHHKNLIAFYEERGQDLEKVLNIFIRTNSGGTKLSHSDLLLSIAVARWSEEARNEVHKLVDDLNKTGDGFNFSKDLVLKAGLMLADIGNVGFKVKNFTPENMDKFEKRWPDVKTALTVAVQLIASFGFNEKNLRADSAVLPIAYYVSHRKLDEKYVYSNSYAADRAAVRAWLIRGLLKASGIWGSGLDTLLTELREIVRTHGTDGFPVEQLQQGMGRRGKSLLFGDDEIDDLVEMKYGDKRLFAILLLLFPFADVKNHFHIDHIFPCSRFTKAKLIRAGVPEQDVDEFCELADELPNLQLLPGNENNEKRASMPVDWIGKSYPSDLERTNYCGNHLLGDIPDSITDFRTFYNARRDALRSRIVKLLVVQETELA